MSYGRIRRGPMAADQFTQIRNAVFRDSRLSAKAMGIFGNISTHRDGWGITPESISTQMRDGVNAIKAGLRELEQYGYLRRKRERRPDGTLGASTYFITDQPDPIDAPEETRRSEPTDDFPPVEKPTVDQPTVDDRPHKKTIPLGKKISSEKTTTSSPAVPETAPSVPAGVTGGGGGGSDLRSIAEHITAHLDYRGKPPDKRQRKTIRDRLLAALAAGWTVDGLALYLDLGDAKVDSPAAVYAHRLRPDVIPDAEPMPAAAARGGVFGELPTAAEIEALTVADVFGTSRQRDTADGGMWERAAARARQRMGGAPKPGGHQPFQCPPPSAYTHGFGGEPAENATPHCGDWDCDPVTRLRDHDVDGGLKVAAPCEKCHPASIRDATHPA